MWEYRFAMKNWTPRVDLNVFFGNEMMSPIDCPKPYDVQDLIQHEMKQGKSQTEAEQHAAATLFKKLSRERRIQCAHWPYAIHGSRFKTPH